MCIEWALCWLCSKLCVCMSWSVRVGLHQHPGHILVHVQGVQGHTWPCDALTCHAGYRGARSQHVCTVPHVMNGVM